MPGREVRVQLPADLGAFGPRAARQAVAVDAFVPDEIAGLDVLLPGAATTEIAAAEAGVARLDEQDSLPGIEVLARRLLRAESVASSRIEGIRVSHRRLAEAEFADAVGDVTARSVLGNLAAMEQAVAIGSDDDPFGLEELLGIHGTLMAAAGEDRIAGRLRTEQNWIGGAYISEAVFVPPPPSELDRLLADLFAFVNERADLPASVQAAIVHAQFETIHPFADGNGRVGRCLVHVVLRRRELVGRVVPPVSVVLAANAARYVDGLVAYRGDGLASWCALFAEALGRAAGIAEELRQRLGTLVEAWREQAGNPRRDSAAARLTPLLAGNPVVNVARVMELLGVSWPAAAGALEHLEASGVLTQATAGRRNRVWGAREVFAVLDELEATLRS